MAAHDLATIDNPSGALTDFTLIVDLSNMSASWWSANDSADGTKGRVFKADGTTELASDWIDFDNGAETGLLRVKWSGTLASSGTQNLWIEPPLAANASYAAGDTYGSDNAYDASTWGYWPLHDANDRTSNGRNLTGEGSLSFGGGTGLIGAATDFNGSSQRGVTAVTFDFDRDQNYSVNALVKHDTETADQGIFGQKDGATFQLWRDEFTSPDRYALYRASGGGIAYGSTAADTNWTVVGGALVDDDSTILYVDGSSDGTGGSLTAAADELSIGEAAGKWMDGLIQHAMLSTIVRVPAWFAQENSQLIDNANFYTTWTWVPISGVVPTPYYRTLMQGAA